MMRPIDPASTRLSRLTSPFAPGRLLPGLPALALLILTLLAGGPFLAAPVSAFQETPAAAPGGESGEPAGTEADAPADVPTDPGAPATVILVRHAEKAVAPEGEEPYTDPPLTEEGMQRAAALAQLLAPANISTVYATQYLRTQETVAPLAMASDLAVNLVDAADTAGLAKALAEHRGETVVVAGHSNTLGPIIEALGGGTIEPIPESEYDRLYIVTVETGEGGARKARVLRLAYGEPSRELDEEGPVEESPESGS